MAVDYSVDTCNSLRERFEEQKLFRPMRVEHYDPGTELRYRATGIETKQEAELHLQVERFVGGGFAGQVYRVKVLEIDSEDGKLEGLEVGGTYALKILIPPSGFSKLFRNVMYWLGFQGAFQPQSNPVAARAGALWQKFIRRGAQARFNDDKAVNNIHVTLVDSKLGSCGELSDWVDGRTWRLEVDDRLDYLKRYLRKKPVEEAKVGSPEYRAKRTFMKDFVSLLHEMGAPEFARQYEWSTAKSQPNCLKRNDSEGNPYSGLTAVDFRAGLALLPFLPMSPGDIKLIFKGLGRGSLVQFDRGNLKKLRGFIDSQPEIFDGMEGMMEELIANELVYRHSIPDITHNFFKLFYSRRLWSTMLSSTRAGWKVRNIIDDKGFKLYSKSNFLTLIMSFIGIIPWLGKFLLKVSGHSGWRKHYGNMTIRPSYLSRSFKGKMAEKIISWHRKGRVTEQKVAGLSSSFLRFFGHQMLSFLPVGIHKFLTDGEFARAKLHFLAVRPFKLYFSAPFREQWLKDMVQEGQEKHILSSEDAQTITDQIGEPFIQKYLKSLAVHVLTLPITQVVSVIVSWVYVVLHPELSAAATTAAVAGILFLFQITPISPGSLVRGFYVLYLVIRERNFKDYNIAVFLGFFKYIGYLAFPIQMAYRYPALARFMAGHWATEAVHVVPVFGEGGALLEHWVFNLFYNWPLTIRRRMRAIAEMRRQQKPRYWHVPVLAIIGAGLVGAMDFLYLEQTAILPSLKDNWWVLILVAMFTGTWYTIGCRGAAFPKRIISAVLGSFLLNILSYGAILFIAGSMNLQLQFGNTLIAVFWRLFVMTVFTAIAVILTELSQPDPNLRN